GALQLPREPANLALDLVALGDAFVVVVVGGMGSIPGAFLAALIIAEIKALCIALGQVPIAGFEISFTKLTLVVEFLVMAAVLIWRPWGLLGRPAPTVRNPAETDAPLKRMPSALGVVLALLVAALIAVPWFEGRFPYAMVLLIDMMIAVLFAASLHFIMGPGGMHSFGHAAYFGLGAYGAGLFLSAAGLPMSAAMVLAALVAGLGAVLFGWFAVRLSGVYLAMLTLALGQIVWSVVFQWDDFTGGSNGLIGIWPAEWAGERRVFYWLTLAVTVLGVAVLWRILQAPFGYAMRAVRDSALRAEAIGIDTHRAQWLGFIVAGAVAGVAGGLFAFSKGSISPEIIAVGRSIDGLVMVLLGGVQALTGPIVGASLFVWLEDTFARETDYWRAMLGGVILLLVLLFPGGIVGSLKRRLAGERA
ncbi:MAG: ABC transporter permease, partial [Burkholderiaceae bacterium]